MRGGPHPHSRPTGLATPSNSDEHTAPLAGAQDPHARVPPATSPALGAAASRAGAPPQDPPGAMPTPAASDPESGPSRLHPGRSVSLNPGAAHAAVRGAAFRGPGCSSLSPADSLTAAGWLVRPRTRPRMSHKGPQEACSRDCVSRGPVCGVSCSLLMATAQPVSSDREAVASPGQSNASVVSPGGADTHDLHRAHGGGRTQPPSSPRAARPPGAAKSWTPAKGSLTPNPTAPTPPNGSSHRHECPRLGRCPPAGQTGRATFQKTRPQDRTSEAVSSHPEHGAASWEHTSDRGTAVCTACRARGVHGTPAT